MLQARRWSDFNRPNLGQWMTAERFNIMMGVAINATWGMNGGKDWAAQTAFLESEDGTKYFHKVNAELAAHITSLKRKP